MPDYDLILRGGHLVASNWVQLMDVGIKDGKIAKWQSNLPGSFTDLIDARGLHIFPGLIDAHVHFNEPGRADWEGFETGTRALAAGGGTLFFDMPLNAHPPTIDAESFDQKLAAASASSLVDFAFWGGLVPGNADKMEELAARGVVGFKAFMSNSGIDDFSCVDNAALREGMKIAARLKKIVAVHAESETMTREMTQERLRAGKTSIRDYLDSRPVVAELEAIRRAIDLAGETGCALHIVHVSCGAGIRLVIEARLRGVNVSCETCPHYLALTEDDVIKLGAVAKCAPPLRSQKEQDDLWWSVGVGQITTIGSDHSPAPPDMKKDENFFKVWGGISGVQHTLPLLLTEGNIKRGVALPLIAQMLSYNVAGRFGLPYSKAGFVLCGDADLALVDLDAEFTVDRADLFYRHQQSPYVGRKLRGRVRQTLLRGQTVFKDGKITSKPLGQLVKAGNCGK